MEPKLSKEKIVQAAFDLLKETPELSTLSMRKVATKLSVQAPAIYWYFDSKQALLQQMAEEMDRHFCPPKQQNNWKETIYAYMESYYELYLQYPCGVEIEMNTVPSYPTRLKNLDAMLKILHEAGFSVSSSYIIVSSLQHLLFGMLVDSSEEKKLHTRFLAGDSYLHQQVDLMKQYVQDNNLAHIAENIQYRQETKQKDLFLESLAIFLNGLSI
ncbi:TetR/AcrR family transcriptional regulator C-terminal domain-containing protein [Enterococcus rivorum]|uniref:TetR family transcriptional regulator n=1 Tax=Enterococcus rivorum TaxID=762845 RepID=A0A1E5L1I6_9ENTE|nr:TetR/AcrR family transcriptional regulator C-terminal domain-containing protein [Enterococcus rivorum]MBP2097715.1 AcrR family transcriptional regulator [Enterococcus rivorum]OEH83986.1 TetR family transcriptional regulator [Enterococcus rivorum]